MQEGREGWRRAEGKYGVALRINESLDCVCVTDSIRRNEPRGEDEGLGLYGAQK